MNREIKFRAWRENKMHYNITTAHYEHNAMSGSGGDLWDFAEWMKWSKVMQYTGLKDKDGKEIYEGDIVNILKENKCYPVNFGNCYASADDNYCGTECFGYHIDGQIMGSRERNWGNGALISENMEVIGNIFENSELLEQ